MYPLLSDVTLSNTVDEMNRFFIGRSFYGTRQNPLCDSVTMNPSRDW